MRHFTSLCLVVVLFFFGLFSCQKDSPISDFTKDDILTNGSSSRYEEWFNSKSDKSELNPFGSMNPIWTSVKTSSDDKLIIHEFSLTNPKKVLHANDVVNDENYNQLQNGNSIRLLIFEDKTNNQILSGCYMSILNEGLKSDLKELQYKQLENLNGKVFYYNIDGSFSNGWSYDNGKIVQKLTGESYLTSANGRTQGSCLYPTYSLGCVGAHPDYMNCSWVVTGCVESKVEMPGDAGGNGGGGYGGNNGGGGSSDSGSDGGIVSVGKFMMSASDQAKYPKFTAMLKGLDNNIKNNAKIMNALKAYTGLTEAQILDKVKFGYGPTIKIASMESSKHLGRYNKMEPYILRLNVDWVNSLEQTTSLSNQQSISFLLAVTTLHEFVHQARFTNGMNTTSYEYGQQFEESAFGLKITSQNASDYSYIFYKK